MFPQTTQGRDSNTGESATRTDQGPSERDGAQAAGSRKRPTGPHSHKKVVVLGSMLGPSALFNTGYRHGANGDGKEPRQAKRGKEDSAVGCHFGRREFELRGALREIYATSSRFKPRRLARTAVRSLHTPVGYRRCLYQARRNQYIILHGRSFSGHL
eukprot:scaffold28007_cov61-Attheya_sp.AAC.1